MKANFIERTLSSLMSASEFAASAEAMAASGGALQQIDARVKVAGIFALIGAVAASRNIRALLVILLVGLLLALVSGVRLGRLAAWVWIPVLFFTGAIAAPALFLTPGTPLVSYGPLTITRQGLSSSAFLLARAETAATLSALLVLTTPWPWVLKALRTFRCPAVAVVILGMTYRYVFVILETALDMFESRKSRTVGTLEPAERRRLSAAAAGVLLSKSLALSGEVHLAMQSRGFRGEVHVMHDFRTGAADWCWLAAFGAVALAAGWWGR